MTIRQLFKQKDIPVTFLNNVDTSLFDQIQYSNIQTNGIKLSPINIIHYACIHYSGRYKKNSIMKFINSFVELIPSIQNSSGTDLYLSDEENNEFQAKSSEVLAVGICIGLTSKLFAINKNEIGLIEGSGKRCDFYFIKNNLEYYIESKGRKGAISSAISDVLDKKSEYQPYAPKYGIISQLPRNGNKVHATVVDPDFIPTEITFREKIRRLLFHYSKVSYLAGFWLLGDLLVERSEALREDVDISTFDKKALDYGNIYKFGNVLDISIGNHTGKVFIPRDNRIQGIRESFENYTAVFLMDQRLMKILEEQDFHTLVEYRMQENNHHDSLYSIHNDGSIFAFINKAELDQYR